EQRGEEWRQHCVQVKVVPLEHRAQRRREDDFLLFAFCVTIDGRIACGHEFPSSVEGGEIVSAARAQRLLGKLLIFLTEKLQARKAGLDRQTRKSSAAERTL